MNIRFATVGEHAGLCQLAWETKAPWGCAHDQPEAWRDDLSPALDSIISHSTHVIEFGTELAGFYQLDVSCRLVELTRLWVRPRFMRRGLGRALLGHASEQASQLSAESLHIDSDPSAEPFYIANGATRIGLLNAPIRVEPARQRPQLRLPTIHRSMRLN
jgi:GNAT superfamily N-acetyltransferase